MHYQSSGLEEDVKHLPGVRAKVNALQNDVLSLLLH